MNFCAVNSKSVIMDCEMTVEEKHTYEKYSATGDKDIFTLDLTLEANSKENLAVYYAKEVLKSIYPEGVPPYTDK